MEDKKPELLPCPFCGKPVSLGKSNRVYCRNIKCPVTPYSNRPSNSIEEAFNLWNARAPKMAAQIESLQKQNAEQAERIEEFVQQAGFAEEIQKQMQVRISTQIARIAELEKANAALVQQVAGMEANCYTPDEIEGIKEAAYQQGRRWKV